MKKSTIELLKKKGWSEKDILEAEKIISSRRLIDKSRGAVYSNRVLFWTVVFVIVLGNFIISILFVPFLLALNKLTLNILAVIIGFAFGSLFNMLILDVENVSKKHHLIAGIMIPALALINISVMISIANAINDVLKINMVKEDPITISIFYVVAFMVPYLWSVLVKKRIDFAYNKSMIHSSETTKKEFLKKY